ncbi:hypothetical protein ABLV90_01850 [Staphylococcus sp. 2S1]
MTDTKINTDTTQRLTERINQVLESNVPSKQNTSYNRPTTFTYHSFT